MTFLSQRLDLSHLSQRGCCRRRRGVLLASVAGGCSAVLRQLLSALQDSLVHKTTSLPKVCAKQERFIQCSAGNLPATCGTVRRERSYPLAGGSFRVRSTSKKRPCGRRNDQPSAKIVPYGCGAAAPKTPICGADGGLFFSFTTNSIQSRYITAKT